MNSLKLLLLLVVCLGMLACQPTPSAGPDEVAASSGSTTNAGVFVLRASETGTEACKRIVANASSTPGSDGYYRVHNNGPNAIEVEAGVPADTRTCGGPHTRGAKFYKIQPGDSLDVWKGLSDDLWVHIEHTEEPGASGWYVRVSQ